MMNQMSRLIQMLLVMRKSVMAKDVLLHVVPKRVQKPALMEIQP